MNAQPYLANRDWESLLPHLGRTCVTFMAAALWLSWTVVALVAAPPLDAHSKPHRSEDDLRSWAQHELLHEFDSWAAVQSLYDSARIQQMRAELTQRLQSLSGDELEDFIDEADRKLRILNSAAAREARHWLQETLAVSSPKRAERVRAQLPDVAKMNAEELEESLKDFEDQRSHVRRDSEAFTRQRQDTVAAARAQRQQELDWNEQAASSVSSASGYQPAVSGTNRPFGGQMAGRYGRSQVHVYWGSSRW